MPNTIISTPGTTYFATPVKPAQSNSTQGLFAPAAASYQLVVSAEHIKECHDALLRGTCVGNEIKFATGTELSIRNENKYDLHLALQAITLLTTARAPYMRIHGEKTLVMQDGDMIFVQNILKQQEFKQMAVLQEAITAYVGALAVPAYMGQSGEFAHLVFDSENQAANAVRALNLLFLDVTGFKSPLYTVAGKDHPTYAEGTHYLRINKENWDLVASKIGQYDWQLHTFDKLQVYQSPKAADKAGYEQPAQQKGTCVLL